MNLRIHHFFDIIRDFGCDKNIKPHEYGHAYHEVARQIKENANLEINLVIDSDEICTGCSKLTDGDCVDIITHRTDFKWKEDFNNYLDIRIMEVCGLHISKKYSPKILCEFAHKYIENIDFIYLGNDEEHTELRKQNVIAGLRHYSENHGLNMAF